MIDRAFPVGARRAVAWVITAAALGSTAGCAVTKTIYADDQVRPYLRSLANRPDYPLARTLTWKYHYTLGKGSDESVWFVADGTLIRNATAGVQIYAAQPSTSGVTTSDLYTWKAHEATKVGKHYEAQFYHGLSGTALQAQIASERLAAGMALGSAIQGLGAALLDTAIVSGSENAAMYVKDDRVPVIRQDVPEGTVLELFFRAHKLDGADAKPANVTMRWETVATLKDAQGKIWRSSASFMTYINVALGEGKSAPAEFNQSRYVLIDEKWFLPATDSRDAFATEVQEIGKIARRGGYIELGVTASQAISDLYEQIEFAKRNPVKR